MHTHKEETYIVATNPYIEHPLHKWLHVLFAGESQTKAGHKQGPKLYHFHLLHLVMEGSGSFQTERGHYSLEKGDIFLIRPHELIAYEASQDNPWHYVWVAFKGEQVESMLTDAGFSPSIDVVSSVAIDKAVKPCQAIYDVFKEKQPSATTMANGLLHVLLASIHQQREQHSGQLLTFIQDEHPLAKQMVQYLTTQYANPISIEVMAATLGYNRAYLSRLFKRYTGVSPRTYLLHFRLNQARHLLRARPQLTIEQVAASVGIQDALYFSKQFTAFFKQTPTEYRASQR